MVFEDGIRVRTPGYNPAPTKNLQTEIQRVCPDKYFIPEQDHWNAVLPQNDRGESLSYPRVSDGPRTNNLEYLQLGCQADAQFFATHSDYSQLFSDDDENQDTVWYAIRFSKIESPQVGVYYEYLSMYDPFPSLYRFYEPIRDNSLRCAYRYTRVGGSSDWHPEYTIEHESGARRHPKDPNSNNNFIVDVIYLGEADFEESGKTALETISNPDWWDSPSSSRYDKGHQVKVQRILPAPGYTTFSYQYRDNTFMLTNRGSTPKYRSLLGNSAEIANQYIYHSQNDHHRGLPVRLFRRRVD